MHLLTGITGVPGDDQGGGFLRLLVVPVFGFPAGKLFPALDDLLEINWRGNPRLWPPDGSFDYDLNSDVVTDGPKGRGQTFRFRF